MKIKFKLGDFDEIVEQYSQLLEEIEPKWIEIDDGRMLRVEGFRVIISKIKTSFRMGELFFRNDNVENLDDDMAWEFVHSVDISYKNDEKDPSKFLDFSTMSIQALLEERCEKYKYPIDEIDSLNCYIETSEFIEEDIIKNLYPKDWKQAIKTQYPELFKVIKKKKYGMSKEYDGAELTIYSSEFNYINITLSQNSIRFAHCGHYIITTRNEEEYQSVYKRIVELTGDIVEERIAIIYMYSSEKGRDKEVLFAPAEEARLLDSEEKCLDYLKDNGIVLWYEKQQVQLTIDVYLWKERWRFKVWLNTPER